MDPQCFALLFADRVIEEKSGKKGLIGVFNTFSFPQFPAGVPQWFIFAAIDNITRGRYSFSMNLVHDDDQIVVLPIHGEINVENEDEGAEFVFPVTTLAFPKAGKYTLTFNISGHQVGKRILKVNKIDKPS